MKAIFASTGLALLIAASAAFAQDPATPGTPGAGTPKGRAARQGQIGGGRQGGGMGGRMTIGTITGGDMNAGIIVITPQFGGGSQTIKVDPSVKFVAQKEVTVGSLKAGDKIQVTGVPASISATSIVAGDAPDFLQFGRNRNNGNRPATPNGAGGATGASTSDPAADPNNPPQPEASAMAIGKVVTTNPLVIVINTNLTISLKLASSTKVTKYTEVKLTSLKLGDVVTASGSTGDDGTFNATGVGVNIQMTGGRGFGGRGGNGGPGGGTGGAGRGNRGNRAGANGSANAGAGGAGSDTGAP